MAGRKRHIAVDTDGRLLMINLTTADIANSAGRAGDPRRDAQAPAVGFKHLFADGAHDRRKLMDTFPARYRASHGP